MAAKVDLTNRVFERLTVVQDSGGRSSNGGVLWQCMCACGGQALVRGDLLQSGHTASCGCKQSESAARMKTKHGLSKNEFGKTTPTYDSWNSMMQRVKDRRPVVSKYYVEKGITVCEDWHWYPNFLRDMGERPEGMTLDRIDGNLGYSKSNCRWATDWEQGQNRSNGAVHFSTFPVIQNQLQNGWSIKQIAESHRVSYRTMLGVVRRRIPAWLQHISSGEATAAAVSAP